MRVPNLAVLVVTLLSGCPGSDHSVPVTDTDFAQFVRQIDGVGGARSDAMVDSFFAVQVSVPLVENDSTVIFVLRQEAQQVTVPGDANGWDPSSFAMARVGTTDLWYRAGRFEPDARLDYKFVVDGEDWILDPLNPKQVSGGAGPNSELAMPRYVQPWEIERKPDVARGTLTNFKIESVPLGNSRAISVYVPPGYDDDASTRYPLVLFHDGADYLEFGSAFIVLDNLIAQRLIPPVIGVFVPPVDRLREYVTDLADDYELFITEQLMSEVSARFRVANDPRRRVTLGASAGALISAQLCYRRPGVFGNCGLFSPAFWPEDRRVAGEIMDGETQAVRFYIDWGAYEPRIASGAREVASRLHEKGYEVKAAEWHEGHSWGSWRAHLDEALVFFFRNGDG